MNGDLAGQDDQPGGDQRLARAADVRVVFDQAVQHGVGDGVGHLIGVTDSLVNKCWVRPVWLIIMHSFR